MRTILLLLLVCSMPLLAAGIELREFDSPEQEAQYRALIQELRCTVCQNQNIAESNAELAVDLRKKTYEMLREGQSEAQIKDFLAERYGNFVLYNPPLEGGTLALWVIPFIILGAGAGLLLSLLRRRRRADDPVPVDEDRLRHAAALLDGKEDSRS